MEPSASPLKAGRDVPDTTSEPTWQELCDGLGQIQDEIAALLTSVYGTAAASGQRRQSANPTPVELAKLERARVRREMIELAMQVYLEAPDSLPAYSRYQQ